jgi:Glycolipid 2-alpha-mannosyltransferase
LSTEPGQGSLDEIDPYEMEGESYNMCHFWSNFEIARLDWFRSKEYNDFFETMDKSGGFWMERVSFVSETLKDSANQISGEMHQSIRLQLEHYLVPRMFTTFAISDTGIRPSSIVLQMPPRDKEAGYPSLSRKSPTKRKRWKRTSIG